MLFMQTCELLGYPKEARLLIVNIDDYGLCYTANDSAVRLLRQGAASSCTVMAPAQWGLDGLLRLADNPHLHCGVHLTAISEHVRYRWRPLTRASRIPTLVDEDGYFYLESRQDEFIHRARVEELEIEWRAQIEIALRHGLRISHLDSHCNTHDSRQDIFWMTVRLAQEYGLALRVHNPDYLPALRQRNLPAIDYPDVDSFRLPVEGKRQIYLEMLHNLPAGLSEWAIHPAYESDELKALTPEWQVRASDYAFFASADFGQALRAEGIQLVHYSLLQPFWRGSAG